MSKNKTLKYLSLALVPLVLLALGYFFIFHSSFGSSEEGFLQIKSLSQLERLYQQGSSSVSYETDFFSNLLALPFYTLVSCWMIIFSFIYLIFRFFAELFSNFDSPLLSFFAFFALLALFAFTLVKLISFFFRKARPAAPGPPASPPPLLHRSVSTPLIATVIFILFLAGWGFFTLIMQISFSGTKDLAIPQFSSSTKMGSTSNTNRSEDFIIPESAGSSNSLMLDSISPAQIVGSSQAPVPSLALGIDDFTAETTTQRDYSTTNIQVENVDEADVIKTDGNYIYSLVNDKVVITDVTVLNEPKIASETTLTDSAFPLDLLLAQGKLLVIGTNNAAQTIVNLFDLTDPTRPRMIKQLALDQTYYTSRLTDGKLYLLTEGTLRQDRDGEFNLTYYEDYARTQITPQQIYYSPTRYTTKTTVIATLDLSDLEKPAQISWYLLDLTNVYVSQNNLYLVNQGYDRPVTSQWESAKALFQCIFGVKGIWGLNGCQTSGSYISTTNLTKIYKFALSGTTLDYLGKAELEGKTLNQFSIDESASGYIRLALDNKSSKENGAKVVILDAQMNQVGEVVGLGKNEDMYASRFIGDRAYLVTYQTTDPLFVIDLKDPTNPKVLGQLKIPGYSTYLHPYDENYLIGIGMQTQETYRRDAQGQVISTTAVLTGMKMALFDVSDVNRPEQVDEVTIGDARTTSAILTNHKALLFSKEKGLLAIPVNNFDLEFSIPTSETNVESLNQLYTSFSGRRLSEGYLVYGINLEGFQHRGTITHAVSALGNTSNLLRGLYIDNDLFTVSQALLKIHDLQTLELLGGLKFDQTVSDPELDGEEILEDELIEAEFLDSGIRKTPDQINFNGSIL